MSEFANSLPRSELNQIRFSSDHGSQYVSLLLSKTMRESGIRPSVG